MDFSLNSDQKILRDTVRQFMETEMRPVLRAYEREEKFPTAELRELGELGCCGMLIPEEWGGAGMDTVSYVVMLEEVARVCASTAVTLSVTNSVVAVPIWKHGTDEQKRKYLTRLARGEILGSFCLTEPQAGSDALAIQTRAARARVCILFSRRRSRQGRQVQARARSRRFWSSRRFRVFASRDMKIRWGCGFRSRRKFR